MQNHFPLWKNLLILIVFFIGVIYALPNLYGDDPSVQVSSTRSTHLEQEQTTRIENILKNAGLVPKTLGKDKKDNILIRFDNTEKQMHAADLLRTKLGSGYTVALNLAPATPAWLNALGASPMYLGLDLRGGVHFLLEVDMDAAIKQAQERYINDIRSALRTAKIRYRGVSGEQGAIRVKLKNEKTKLAAE